MIINDYKITLHIIDNVKIIYTFVYTMYKLKI